MAKEIVFRKRNSGNLSLWFMSLQVIYLADFLVGVVVVVVVVLLLLLLLLLLI